jgi:hypothetical protein
MCSGTCRYVREKKIFNRKTYRTIFLFQVFDLRFFTQMFILQQCLDPNPYPNPNFFSDSDPAKTFGFFRIRIHNTEFLVYLLILTILCNFRRCSAQLIHEAANNPLASAVTYARDNKKRNRAKRLEEETFIQ